MNNTVNKKQPEMTIQDILANTTVDTSKEFAGVNQPITGIELVNSIYNLWMHYFDDALSYIALVSKKHQSFKDFQKKLFDDGFTKIVSSLSVDNRSAYYINKTRKILAYVSLGKTTDLNDNSQIAIPTYGGETFSASFCHAITDENREYMENMISFYSTLQDLEKTKIEHRFYMIAQTSTGLKKLEAECKPRQIKDDRFDLYYGKKFPIDKIKSFMTDTVDQNLMLLHGEPGTGKSNLIRHLIKHSDRNTIYIPPAMTASIASPSFIEFIMENKKSVLLIEDAEEILSKDRNSATNNLLGLTDGFLKDCLDLKIIATFNKDINDIDMALRRPGRLFFEYKFDKLLKDEVQDLVDFAELSIPDHDIKEMTLAEVFGYGQELRLENSLDKRPMGFAALGR